MTPCDCGLIGFISDMRFDAMCAGHSDPVHENWISVIGMIRICFYLNYGRIDVCRIRYWFEYQILKVSCSIVRLQ